MTRTIRYASDADSLFLPGKADNFFEKGGAISEAALCAEMARVAYVKHEEAPGEKKLIDILRKIGFTISGLFNAGGTQGFVADGPAGGETIRVIAFRGTEPDDKVDLAVDLKAFLLPWAGAGRVHVGFAEALELVEERVAAAMQNPPGRVVMTGHSLGAALATLAASRHAGSQLYAFGSPRVGDAVFAATISRDRHRRYVDFVDAVTTVPPPLGTLAYVHLEPAIFIDADGILHPDLPDAKIHDLQTKAGRRRIDIAKHFRERSMLDANGIPLRDLTDHAPFNYVAPLMPLLA